MANEVESLEEIQQPAWRCDQGGQTVECNRRWYEYTGQTSEKARGFGWMEAIHPDDKSQVIGQMVRASNSGVYEARYRLRRASDGSYRWNLARGFPVTGKDNKVTGWLGITIDIEQQQALGETPESLLSTFS